MRPQPASDTDQLLADEGEVLKMYQDSRGIRTIGVGHNLETTGISHAASRQILADDIASVVAVISKWPVWTLLDPIRQGVLVNIGFWAGVDGLGGFHHMLYYATEKQYGQAAAEILTSHLWVTNKDRAIRLSEQMRTGVRQ